MNRRAFVCGMISTALAAPLVAEAQQTGRIYRVGLLAPGYPGTSTETEDGFRGGLRDLDYIEGANLVLEARYAEGRYDRYPELLTDLLRLRCDVIVTITTVAAAAAKAATSTVPVVMLSAADPVGSGVVASLARPGANITGVTLDSPGVTGKRLEFLTHLLPRLSSVALARLKQVATAPVVMQLVEETEAAARTLGLVLTVVDIGDEATAWYGAFEVIRSKGVEALVVMEGARFYVQREEIAMLAVRYRLPAVYPFTAYVEAGGSSPTGRACSITPVVVPAMSTRFSGARARATCPSSSPRSSTSSSTSRPLALSASPSHRRCCCGRIR